MAAAYIVLLGHKKSPTKYVVSIIRCSSVDDYSP